MCGKMAMQCALLAGLPPDNHAYFSTLAATLLSGEQQLFVS
jgi:hypothetical protein